MLELQFILTYQETDYIVDEPDGFKNFNSVLERDFDTHGVFFRFTDSDLKLKFPGTGRDVLKAARDGFGVDAIVDLTVKRRFKDSDPFTTIYTGTAVIENLEIDEDFASTDFEEVSEMIKIKDRLDVPVKTTQTESFDGDAISEATETAFTMGAKTIEKVSSAILGPASPANVLEIRDIDSSTGLKLSGLDTDDFLFIDQKQEIEYQDGQPGFSRTANELEDTANPSYALMGGVINAPTENIDYTIEIAVTGNLELLNDSGNPGRGDLYFYLDEYVQQPIDRSYNLENSLLIKQVDLSTYADGDRKTLNFNYSVSRQVSNQSKTYKIRVFVEDTGAGTDFQALFLYGAISGGLGTIDFTISATIQTAEPETSVNGYFIHETLRHNLAAITGEENFLYAPFFGRIADGYAENGCAYNYTEANGWRIRGFTNAVIGSLKQRLDSLKAIFGVGYGLERSGVGEGFRLRVDTYDYFYNDELLYEFTNVVDYKEEFYDWFSFNEVEVGYKTSTTDEDEPGSTEDFNSKASWIVPVQRLRGKKSFLSEYIGSDLLAEITRRVQFNQKPTTSYKYDDDLFINEVEPDGSGGWEIGTDKSVVRSGNINPLFNVLINPTFNFFNQYQIINSVSYRKTLVDTYKNTTFKNGGDLFIYYSNFLPSDNCLGDLIQGGPSPVPPFNKRLNDDITLSRYREGKRLFDPIKISFKHSLSTAQVDNIIEAYRNGAETGNYGFIRATNPDGETVEGWLLSLKFNYADQIGQFELIKKADTYSI